MVPLRNVRIGADFDRDIILGAFIKRTFSISRVGRITFFKRRDNFIFKSQILSDHLLQMMIERVSLLRPPFLIVWSEPLHVFALNEVFTHNGVDSLSEIFGG